ncbi:MAG: hypothetical protein NZM02_00360 [Patescibacteria group bacterium]|nr:hypothetical protein [Patescibacteria group bacterium]
MLKIEYIWRDLLDRVIEDQNLYFTILELSKKYRLSTSVVNYALNPLKELNIIKIRKFSSRVIDWEKLLFFWATRRSLVKDIIYSTYSNLPVFEREVLMPADVIPTGYTAFRIFFKKTPSDYDVVYFYSQKPEKVKKRFPPSKKKPNIFILKPDRYLAKKKKISLSQLFVDLWNMSQWYAKDFQEALILEIKKKLNQ